MSGSSSWAAPGVAGRERRRPREERYRERDHEGFPFERWTGESGLPREDHPKGDQEQDDPAGDADGLLFEAEEPQEILPGHQEHHQHDVGDEDLAEEHDAAPRRRHGLEDRQEQGDVPERIHDEEQGHDGGKQVHSEPASAPFYPSQRGTTPLARRPGCIPLTPWA